jgi:Poly(A) polymerase catalytic subunit
MSHKNENENENKNKFHSEHCNNDMTFQECELAILRHAVDESEKLQGQKVANSEEVKKIIKILENFLIEKKCICYGGTAINNILPKYAQFYNKDIEIPDYDFFTPNALDDAKELADIFHKEGYPEVEAKSGIHFGTYKVFVNFIPIADITYLHPEIFQAILKESISVAGIKYAPPNFLRMSMYLELSRPSGDVSRWEKVLKRLTLLNRFYPFEKDLNCETIDFQRKMTSKESDVEKLYFTTRDSLIEQGVIFFGGYASSLYSRYMPINQKRKFMRIPDFDVLSEEPEKCSLILRERLEENGFKNIEEIHHEPVGEIIPERIEIRVGKDTIAFIYYPIACHNYNTITIGNQEINVATIDTILSFYLAFIYSDKYSYFRNRILCMAKFLFHVEEENRLAQKGVLKRFSVNCIGKQPGLEEIRAEKAAKFKEMAAKKGTREYEMWFLKYNPGEMKGTRGTNETNKTNKTTVNKKGKNTSLSSSSSSSESESESESESDLEPEPYKPASKKTRAKKKKSNSLMASLFTSRTYSVKRKRSKGSKGNKRNKGKRKTRKLFTKRKAQGYLY